MLIHKISGEKRTIAPVTKSWYYPYLRGICDAAKHLDDNEFDVDKKAKAIAIFTYQLEFIFMSPMLSPFMAIHAFLLAFEGESKQWCKLDDKYEYHLNRIKRKAGTDWQLGHANDDEKLDVQQQRKTDHWLQREFSGGPLRPDSIALEHVDVLVYQCHSFRYQTVFDLGHEVAILAGDKDLYMLAEFEEHCKPPEILEEGVVMQGCLVKFFERPNGVWHLRICSWKELGQSACPKEAQSLYTYFLKRIEL